MYALALLNLIPSLEIHTLFVRNLAGITTILLEINGNQLLNNNINNSQGNEREH